MRSKNTYNIDYRADNLFLNFQVVAYNKIQARIKAVKAIKEETNVEIIGNININRIYKNQVI